MPPRRRLPGRHTRRCRTRVAAPGVRAPGAFIAWKHSRHVEETRARHHRRHMSAGIVIVGGGIAGQAVCEALRERDRDVAITLVCGESSAPYDRVRLSEILVSGEDPETLQLRPARVVRRPRRRAARRPQGHVGRRRARRRSGSTTSRSCAFDKLVLATGSQPLMPPIPGIDLHGVHPFRDPADCEAIRRAAATAASKRAAVIGGGLLGLEAARGIAAQGCAGDRRAPARPAHGAPARRRRRARCSRPRLPASTSTSSSSATRSRSSGPHAPTACASTTARSSMADLVVVSIGIRPEIELARSMGVVCDRGIIVDDGDAHEHARRARRRRVRPAPRHRLRPRRADPRPGACRRSDADRAERRAPTSARFRARSSRSPASTSSAPATPSATTRPSSPTPPPASIASSRSRDGRVVGTILLGDTRGSEALVAAVRSGDPIDDPLQALADASLAGPADLPDTAQICDCNGVCKGALVAGRHRRRLRDAARGHGRHARGHGLRLLPPGGHRDRRRRDRRAVATSRPTCARVASRRARSSPAASATTACSPSARSPAACGTGRECGVCKPALAYLVSEVNANQPPRGARRALHQRPRAREHPEATARSRSSRGCTAASARPTSCAGSPTSPTSTRSRW